MRSKKIKAFTLAEMMVTLALTGMMVSFCYVGYNYIQKLLLQFNVQSFFITQLSELDKRVNHAATLSQMVMQAGEGVFIFKQDTASGSLELKKEVILLKRFGQTDTFHLAAQKINTGFERMDGQESRDKLVNLLEFDVYFQKQKFHLAFHKNYDALTKLNFEKENQIDIH